MGIDKLKSKREYGEHLKLTVEEIKEILLTYYDRTLLDHKRTPTKLWLSEISRPLIITPTYANYGWLSAVIFSINGSPPKGIGLFVVQGSPNKNMGDMLLLGNGKKRTVQFVEIEDLRNYVPWFSQKMNIYTDNPLEKIKEGIF